jgi:hypothetical protein
MTENLDDIETLVKEALIKIPPLASAEKWPDDNRWTQEIKKALRAIGKGSGYYVYSSGSRSAQGEWLWDMTWLIYENHRLISVPLALESEWKPNGVSDDFQKLLVSRALHRVMIFQAKKRGKSEDIIKGLIEEVKQYRQTQVGDRYLFAPWLNETNQFEFTVYVA